MQMEDDLSIPATLRRKRAERPTPVTELDCYFEDAIRQVEDRERAYARIAARREAKPQRKRRIKTLAQIAKTKERIAKMKAKQAAKMPLSGKAALAFINQK